MGVDDQNSGPPGAPSRFTVWVIIAVITSAFLWLSFASKIPTSSNIADKTPPEHAASPVVKHVRVGGRATVTTAFVGCEDRADISRIKSLALDGDREAAIKYAHSHTCVGFEKGAVARVESLSPWSGTTCIRKDGEPTCYWFPTPFLEAQSKASDERSNRKPSGYATGGTYACAKFESIKALYDAITTGSSSPTTIFADANRSCIKMGDEWPVFISEETEDGYARIESPGNFEGQLWTARLSITSGQKD